jgi:hypothetical protein
MINAKAAHASSHFMDYVERIDFQRSTGQVDLITKSNYTDTDVSAADAVMKSMTEDIEQDKKFLAEELPKVQALNSRLCKESGGKFNQFFGDYYQQSAHTIFRFSKKD